MIKPWVTFYKVLYISVTPHSNMADGLDKHIGTVQHNTQSRLKTHTLHTPHSDTCKQSGTQTKLARSENQKAKKNIKHYAI